MCCWFPGCPKPVVIFAAEPLLMAELDQCQLAEREKAISLLWMSHSSLGRTRYERLGITVNKNQFSFLKKGGRANGGKGFTHFRWSRSGHDTEKVVPRGTANDHYPRKPGGKVSTILPTTGPPTQRFHSLRVTTERGLQAKRLVLLPLLAQLFFFCHFLPGKRMSSPRTS